MKPILAFVFILPIIEGLRSFTYSLKRSRFLNSLSFSILGTKYDVDVCVLGGGIAGSTISWLLQERENCSVVLVDPKVDQVGAWYPNYGEWQDEWHALSDRLALPELKGCTTNEWEVTDCFFGGSYDVPIETRTTLDRPYVRVDRIKMQKLYRDRFKAASGLTIASKLSANRISSNLFDKGLVHDCHGSSVVLDNGDQIKCKVLIDSTGLESKLIEKESPMLARGTAISLEPGFQIAYGFIATVDSMGPYNFSAMTLFDYRFRN
jgi:lycopene beta-cyclase